MAAYGSRLPERPRRGNVAVKMGLPAVAVTQSGFSGPNLCQEGHFLFPLLVLFVQFLGISCRSEYIIHIQILEDVKIK